MNMVNKYTVAICDDEETNRDDWSKGLYDIPGFRELFNVKPIIAERGGEFLDGINGLGKRRKDARDKNLPGVPGDNLFDSIDLLIVDYDLINAQHVDWITGEEIAYLARCYSNCGAIVAVNQYGSNPFDLNLTGHFPESFADVNLGDKQVTNPGLWLPEWGDGFRPWYWPMLSKLISDMEARFKDVSGENIKRTVKDVLGFHDEAWSRLPRETIAWITPRGASKESGEITVEDVVLNSPLGLRHKDELWSKEAAARIAAARLGQWLDYAVLAAQDILVDAPHLVERYTSLANIKEPSPDELNTFARITSATEIGLDDERLAKMAFEKNHWLSRPAWYWPEVTQAEWIQEVSNPWGTAAPDAFFCEDVSRFFPMNQTREFRIRVPSVYDSRRCINLDVKGAEPWKADLASVDYQPFGRLLD
ncbi:MAG: hypothetical protein KBH41_17255 [Azonexus sp.]|nr:hypothetical protein [Azonexus sp.]